MEEAEQHHHEKAMNNTYFIVIMRSKRENEQQKKWRVQECNARVVRFHGIVKEKSRAYLHGRRSLPPT